MGFREDVLRGLRLGAIAFAALLVGVAVYRVSREPAAAESVEQKQPPEAAQPAVPHMSADSPVVPAPPPIASSRPQVKRHPAGQKTIVADSAPPVATEPSPIPADKLEPVEVKPQQPVEHAEIAPAAAAPDDDAAAKQDPRSKRWVKAVGRFLHIAPKKDVQPSAVRQP